MTSDHTPWICDCSSWDYPPNKLYTDGPLPIDRNLIPHHRRYHDGHETECPNCGTTRDQADELNPPR